LEERIDEDISSGGCTSGSLENEIDLNKSPYWKIEETVEKPRKSQTATTQEGTSPVKQRRRQTLTDVYEIANYKNFNKRNSFVRRQEDDTVLYFDELCEIF